MTLSLALSAPTVDETLALLLVGKERIDPVRRRVRLVGDDLEGFVLWPGLRVELTAAAGSLRRVCPVEAFDAEELRLEVTLPVVGDPAADRWAEAAEIGDAVTVALV